MLHTIYINVWTATLQARGGNGHVIRQCKETHASYLATQHDHTYTYICYTKICGICFRHKPLKANGISNTLKSISDTMIVCAAKCCLHFLYWPSTARQPHDKLLDNPIPSVPLHHYLLFLLEQSSIRQVALNQMKKVTLLCSCGCVWPFTNQKTILWTAGALFFEYVCVEEADIRMWKCEAGNKNLWTIHPKSGRAVSSPPTKHDQTALLQVVGARRDPHNILFEWMYSRWWHAVVPHCPAALWVTNSIRFER